jgi:predicted transcriptional regulator
MPKENIVVEDSESLIALTADIVSAHVSNNSVSTNDVGPLIQSVFGALQALGAPPPVPEVEKPKGAVSARASVKPDHLISMIDGKPYKTLRRHLSRHGYTPESYRDTFGLAADYPMVAANYAEHRRALAHKIGLGRKPRAEPAPEPQPEPVAEPKRRGRRPRAEAAE